MATISAKVSKKELDAIREYANACGETMSNLIRKVLNSNAIYLNCFGGPNEYQSAISIPDNASGKEDDEITQATINKIRRILGLAQVTII